MPKREKRTTRPIIRAEGRTYKAFFENAAEGFFRCTPAGRFTEINPALLRLLGYESIEEVAALTLPEVLSLQVQETEGGVYVAATDRREEREVYCKRKDGGSVVLSVHMWAVRDAQQRIIAYEGAVADITTHEQVEEMRRIEAALAASLTQEGEKQTTMLTPSTMLTRLCRLAVEAVNCHASHAFLWRPHEKVYLPIAGWGDTREQWRVIRAWKVPGEQIPSLPSQSLLEEMVSVTTTTVSNLFPREVWPVDVTTHHWLALRYGETLVGALSLDYQGRSAPMSPQQERRAHGIGAMAALALASLQLRQELLHANRLKTDFVATISHELRTPLSIVLGYAHCLLEGDFGGLTSEQSKALHAIDHSGRELLELIVALLEASQLATIKPPVEHQEVNIVDLIADVQHDIKDLANRPGLALRWQVSPTLPSLYTDRIKLKIILKNLLSNAIKFTPEGMVTVEVFPREEGVVFQVSDTGIGVAPELLPVIFELFRQGDSSATRRYRGIGLGLYTVRQLLAVLGGSITVESKQECGSIFRVWLPINSKAATTANNSS